MRWPQPSILPRVRAPGWSRQPVVAAQHDACAAVGDLAAVVAPQPALDDRVGVVVVGQRFRNRPGAGLSIGVDAGVGAVECRDGSQVGLVEAVSAVVLGGDAVEHVRPHEPGCGHMNLASRPSCPVQAAAPRIVVAVSPGTAFSSSIPTTSAVRYAPERRSAIAASAAALPDAHAALWRSAGVPHRPSLTVAGIAPRWP